MKYDYSEYERFIDSFALEFDLSTRMVIIHRYLRRPSEQ